jgi:hypothetical protein
MSKKDYKKALHWHLQEGYVKVGVPLSKGNREWLWCRPIDDKLLEVCNVPFFADEPSFHDVIQVTGEGPFYDFDKVVEHITQPLFMRYEVSDNDEELLQRFRVFCQSCREHEFNPEGCQKGLVVVAVPWDTKEKSLAVVLECAKTANLEMNEYEG